MFEISQQYLQNQFNALKWNCTKRKRQEEHASGILPETSELMIFGGNSTEVQRKVSKTRKRNWRGKKATEDVLKASNLRNRSLETFQGC